MQRPSQNPTNDEKKFALREIGLYFLRLGATGFGGPLVMVAQMERDLVDRWISADAFTRNFAAIKTLPGPIAFQMVVFLAFERGREKQVGRLAATLAAIAFVLPAMTLMILVASSRTTWESWSWTRSALVGVQASALGLILASLIPLVLATKPTTEILRYAKWIFACFGFAVTLLKPSLEPFAILLCGLISMTPSRTRLLSIAAAVSVPSALVGIPFFDIQQSLFFTCLKAGALNFGSGLAIVPILGGEFVDRLQWLSHTQFLEALMFGQITPGPVLITATYIGAHTAGVTGGVVATIGIFLVPFFNMVTWYPHIQQALRENALWKQFSFGAVACVTGAVVASIIKLLEPVVLTGLEVERLQFDRPVVTLMLWLLIVPVSFALIAKKKQPGWAVVIGGGVISYAALRWF